MIERTIYPGGRASAPSEARSAGACTPGSVRWDDGRPCDRSQQARDVKMPNSKVRVVARVLLASLLASAPASAQQISINVGTTPSVQIAPGTKVTVPVVVDLSQAGSEDIASLQGGLSWNTARLVFDSLRLAVAGWTLTQNTTAAGSGSVNFALFNSTALPATATIVNAYFTAATEGGTRVQFLPTAAGNEAAQSILPKVRPGRMDVCVAAPGKWGDVTGDALVNIVDAQQVARHAVGLAVGDPTRIAATGDVTADGSVNIVDAQQIARFAVSLPAAARVNTDIFTPPAVGSISLTPSIAQQLAPGGSLQVTPTPRSSGGVDVSGCAGITWTSSNAAVASVSPSGVVAGLTPGSTTITARSVTSPTVTANLAVTVPGAVAPPTIFFTETFENADMGSRGWYDNKTAILSTAEKQQGNSSAEFRWVAGGRQPQSGGAMRRKFTPSNSVYISYWVKYSDNWIGSTRTFHPHEFHVLSSLDPDFNGPGHGQMTLYLEHSYQNGGRPRMAIQDNKVINISLGTPPTNLVSVTENRSVAGCNGIVESNIAHECFALAGETPPWYNLKQILGPVVMQPNPGAGYKGNWNFVEAYFQMNTIENGVGKANGVMQYWFNGAQIINRQDILFRTAARPTIQFQQFVMAPFIGSPGSSIEQMMWIDNLTVASGRVQ